MEDDAKPRARWAARGLALARCFRLPSHKPCRDCRQKETQREGRGDAGGLCDRWRGVCRMRSRQSSVGGRRASHPARGGAERLASDDPRAGRRTQAALQSARQLELRDGRRGGHGQSLHSLAARARARRLELDQRHAVRARQLGRLRQLGADGMPRLVVRGMPAVLQVDRALRAGRRTTCAARRDRC